MRLHGHLYVPGVNTRAELEALSNPPSAPGGRVTKATPVSKAGLPQLRKLFPAMIYNHGSELDPNGVPRLAKLYVDNGYVFFAPDRHGQGLSKDAGPYHLDEQNQYEGKPNFGEMDVKLHEKYNKDVIAAVEWFKKQPYVNRDRILMTGISFGGIQTLLTAEKDPGIRGYVPFAPAAESWGVPELRTRLIDAVRNEKAPMFIIQAKGDYSLPIETLGPLLHQKGDPHKWRWKLYPQFGCTNADAHARFAMNCDGIAIWKPDVLEFIEKILE
jgi:dienelactone hydrolase